MSLEGPAWMVRMFDRHEKVVENGWQRAEIWDMINGTARCTSCYWTHRSSIVEVGEQIAPWPQWD